ncbi:DEAD/DEAH box helicase domain protein [Oscillochloris trichoides DG-6]|uniref:DEAD/DEAH box helicase domain protein n=1 Tax=Oscillochloris trichoides DG-6 TaxID=765420 RepID=E1IGS7_9CHLR|nr:DEAD/DEAH box helicase [Oscillochloris trichoides]EFO79603.1 DEAD/DEAH box helicase domain protein [Oscillochloris trichoides DG-6]
MNFADFALHPALMQNVSAQGFTQPTPIQAQTIPLALSGQNLIGLAQTGTGKTAAFVLPILQRLLQNRQRGTQALIVTPTRELAEQINDTIRVLAHGTGLRSAPIYGGVGMEPQERALRAGVEIVVACPGRLIDHLGRGSARLDGVQMLVLDEADRMLDMGFLPAIQRILSALPTRRQTMLFSATLPAELQQLAATTAPHAKLVQIGLVRPAHTITHAIYPVPPHRKTALLLDLLHKANSGSVLVFTRTKHRANRLLQQIAREGHSAAVLHSNKSQNQRQLALDGFRDGRFRILVATDIAARGLDVERISHVINYDIPDTPDAYIHRIGRTGRATRSGDAFTLVTPEDASQVRQIERAIGAPLERRQLAGFDYNAQVPAVNLDERPPRPPRHENRNAPRTSVPPRSSAGNAPRRDQRPARRPV